MVHRAGPRYGNHCVCYCTDCQNFARYLGREDEILDAHGGTDIYQVSPGRLEILEGTERLACVHLTEKPTLRWYTDCCKSPLGNTLASSKVPFIGLITHSFDTSGVEGGVDSLIGPVRARVHGKGATGDTSGLDLHDSAPLSVYWPFLKTLIGAKLAGDTRRNPLFDRETGKPIVMPSRLND